MLKKEHLKHFQNLILYIFTYVFFFKEESAIVKKLMSEIAELKEKTEKLEKKQLENERLRELDAQEKKKSPNTS
jgi:hypothetical protein